VKEGNTERGEVSKILELTADVMEFERVKEEKKDK